jgi:hypothetical protein
MSAGKAITASLLLFVMLCIIAISFDQYTKRPRVYMLRIANIDNELRVIGVSGPLSYDVTECERRAKIINEDPEFLQLHQSLDFGHVCEEMVEAPSVGQKVNDDFWKGTTQ